MVAKVMPQRREMLPFGKEETIGSSEFAADWVVIVNGKMIRRGKVGAN